MDAKTADIIVKIYAVLAWIGAALALLGAIFAGAMLGTILPMKGASMPTWFGGLLTFVLIILAAVYAAVGWGLWNYKPWARIATIVLSVLSLFDFPLGTLIGAVGIWLFGFEESVKALFGAAPSRAPIAKAKPAKKKQ